MPYADNNGLKIHYEVQGDGPPLVLQHGISMSLEDWTEAGYVAELVDRYCLILVDARGHGTSAKPHSRQDYASILMAGDVVAVLDHIGIETTHFFGYSMGGQIGFAFGVNHPERARSLILGGISPYRGKAEVGHLSAGKERILNRIPGADLSGPSSWRDAIPGYAVRNASNDPDALLAANEALMGDDLGSSAEAILAPSLLWAGSSELFHDGARLAASRMRNATFCTIDGAGHTDAFVDGRVLEHVNQFLAKQTKVSN